MNNSESDIRTMRQNASVHESEHTKKGRSCFIYFVCLSKDEVPALEAEMQAFLTSRALRCTAVLYDVAGRPPFVLLNLIDVCSSSRGAVIAVPRKSMLMFHKLSFEAMEHFARSHGVRFVFAEASGSSDIGGENYIEPYALKYLGMIKNYFGFGRIMEHEKARCNFRRQEESPKGRLPLGYIGRNGHIETDARAAEAVNEIFRLFSEGCGTLEIERRIKESYSDIRCPTRNQIYAIIDNSRYIGEDLNCRFFPAIIENRLWLAACRAAAARGIESNEHRFILDRVELKSHGALRPLQYSRSLHAPAYSLIENNRQLCVHACELESMVVNCISDKLGSELESIRAGCLYASSKAEHFLSRANELKREIDELSQIISNRIANGTSVKFTIKEFDENMVMIKLLKISEEYTRFIHGMLSVSEGEINAFIEHLSSLRQLSSREKRYFLSRVVKNVCVSDDEVLISYYSTCLKRIHLKARVRTSEHSLDG